MMKTAIVETEDHARQQAAAQLGSIREMVKAARKADRGTDEDARDEARQTILEDALEVLVNDGWHPPGDKTNSDGREFRILLCTGGPACRITGGLSQHDEPDSAQIEYQDWGTPWTEYRLTSDEEKDVLAYCRTFYFGE